MRRAAFRADECFLRLTKPVLAASATCAVHWTMAMSTFALLGTIAVSAVTIAFAVVLVRFNRKRLAIVRAAASASTSQLERIYTLVEHTGTVAANGYVLARTNRRTDNARNLIPVPMAVPDFPWAGKVIEVTASKEVAFKIVDESTAEPSLLGNVYRPVQVPRHQAKRSAKARNGFAPERYVANSPALIDALREVCSEYPTELLAYLLCIGAASFEFESIDQARIGTSPAWVQEPEHPTCGTCRMRMVLVLQLPGTTISQSALHRGTYYLFGCTKHPDQTTSLGQFT
jgi:hypothetical protein